MPPLVFVSVLAVLVGCAGSTMVVSPGYEAYRPASDKLLIALVGDVRFARLRGGPFGPDESQRRQVGDELCEHLVAAFGDGNLFEEAECLVIPPDARLSARFVVKGREEGELLLPLEGASLQHGEPPASTVLLLVCLHLRMVLRGERDHRSWTLHARGWYALWDNERGQLAAYDLLDASYGRLSEEARLEQFAGSFSRSLTRALQD